MYFMACAWTQHGLFWLEGCSERCFFFSTDNMQHLTGMFDEHGQAIQGLALTFHVSFVFLLVNSKLWSLCMCQFQLVLCWGLCSGQRVMGISGLEKLVQMLLLRGCCHFPRMETSVCREKEWAGTVATLSPMPGPTPRLAAQQHSQRSGAAAWMKGQEPD